MNTWAKSLPTRFVLGEKEITMLYRNALLYNTNLKKRVNKNKASPS